MSRLADRLERDLRELAAGADPSPSAWESIVARLEDEEGSEVARTLAPSPARSTRRGWITAAAAAFVVLAGAIAVLTRAGYDDSTTTADQDLTTFVSPRNGYSVDYVDGEATVTPATQLLGFSEQVDDGFDVVDTDSGAVFRGASTALPELVPDWQFDDQQVDDYLAEDLVLPDRCGVPRRRQAEITVDGEAGRVAECPDHVEATVVEGGRLYLFTLSNGGTDARAVFDAFVDTIDLRPEAAIDHPGLTTTFVSPTYGYSFGYIDRGGLAPATEVWDPEDQELDGLQVERQFDAVETGLTAYFEAASTVVPDGVSIDDWVDEHVTHGQCNEPRSRQEEITIDGQPGRVAECVDQIEATVVSGGRLYVFLLGHERRDARALFDAWVATIDLTPQTATVP